ncbi:MAG: hypothetical protein HWE08_00020 [Alphaproteobacteria bacterium]|nr:hypothetical protein [Alphaproteobacteria bacterium]
MTTAKKIYTRDFIIAMVLYVVTIFGTNVLLSDWVEEQPMMLAALVALIPVLPVLLAARAVIIFSRSWDELQRKQALEGMLISFFVVGMGSFTYGFLEGIGFPRLSMIWVMPALVMVQGLGQLFIRSRY